MTEPGKKAKRGDRTRERVAVGIYIGSLSLTAAHLVHESWSSYFLNQRLAEQTEHVAWTTVAPAPLYAPNAYRILMPTILRGLQVWMPGVGREAILASIDGVLLALTLMVLYHVAVRGLLTGSPERGLRVALLLLSCTAAVLWLTQFLRPETTPTMFYLASALLWTGWSLPIALPACLVLTLAQGFTRADVPSCLGAALLIAAALLQSKAGDSDGWNIRARRQRLWVLGGVTLMVAAGVQVYLQFVRFPHLHYEPGTPVVQLRNNLRLHMWSNALLAAGPVWAAVLAGARGRWRSLLRSQAAVPLLTAALYLPLWLTVGLGAEVRIYLPVVLMLTPLAATLLPEVLGWVPLSR